MVDGYPTYTDLITKDPNNSMTVQLSQYTMAYDTGPFIQDKRYLEQYASLPEQKQAWEAWADTNMSEHLMPPIYLESDEMNEISALVTSVETYANECVLKTIMGVESIDNYDNAIQEMKTRGLDKILERYQAAYERYKAR
jgi:putative aldouronate transport system substrate-binding protein